MNGNKAWYFCYDVFNFFILGNEWDYVILSTVRSLPLVQIDEKPPLAWRKRHLGFITDVNQINVAITRPKLGLIILGKTLVLNVFFVCNLYYGSIV